MKRFTLSIIAILMIALQANAMSLSQARNEARFLTDKMYYELDLTEAQYNYVYEINFDYFYDLNHYRDAYGYLWNRRNEDLGYVLDRWQYNHYIAIEYFYRPVAWVANAWSFVIYRHYRNDLFFYGTPHHYTTYIGSHGWRTNGGRSYFRTHRYHMPVNHRHIAAPRRPEAGHAPRVVVGAGHGGHHNIDHRREEALRRENNRIREEARRREEAQRRENERIREEARRREEAQRRENERIREEARRREEAQRRENERIREENRRREEAQRRENERRREEAQRQENRRREEAQRREENRRREEAQRREENRRREEAQRQENRRREEAQRQESRRREEVQRRENERRQSDNNRTTRSTHTGGRR